MNPADNPVPALPSASVLLMRDGPDGLEVLMMERHGAMGFAAGALVFPGGKIDASDGAPTLIERSHPLIIGGDARELLPFCLGAIRELFEEAGILLATDGAGSALDPAYAGELAARHRDEVLQEPAQLAAMLDAEDLYLNVSDLVHFAHWITPEPVPKRFDTHFFAARAPDGQQAVSDGQEAVQMDWLRPADALEMGEKGEMMLMFPTRLNLLRLSPSSTVDEALQAAREATVVTVMPRPLVEDGELYMTIPPDAGYGVVKEHRDNIPEAAAGNPGLIGKPAKQG